MFASIQACHFTLKLIGLTSNFPQCGPMGSVLENAAACVDINTRPGFLEHKTSGLHLQQAQYRLKTRPRNDCSVWPAQTSLQRMWITALQHGLTAPLPAHPLLKRNDNGTDERGKMLLKRCRNDPGWIQRRLYSLAYFSQVRGARMRWEEGDAWRKTTLGTFDDTGQYAASSRVISHASH